MTFRLTTTLREARLPHAMPRSASAACNAGGSKDLQLFFLGEQSPRRGGTKHPEIAGWDNAKRSAAPQAPRKEQMPGCPLHVTLAQSLF